jgi:hypothetical protein
MKANWECGYDGNNDIGDALDFVSISSPFYPELSKYYDDMAEQWANEYQDST